MNNNNKRITLKHSSTAIVLELVGVVLILSILYLTVTIYPGLQESVPRAYSISGTIAEWGSRSAALIWPITTVYVYIVLTAVSLLIRRFPDDGNHNVKISMTLILILCAKIVFLVFALVSTYSTLMMQDKPSLSVLILPVGVVITVAVGVAMVRNKGRYSLAIKEAKV